MKIKKIYEIIELIGLFIIFISGLLTVIIMLQDKFNPLLNFTATGIFLGLLTFTVGFILKD